MTLLAYAAGLILIMINGSVDMQTAHINSWMVRCAKLYVMVSEGIWWVWVAFNRPYPSHSSVTSIPHWLRSSIMKMIFGSLFHLSLLYQFKKPTCLEQMLFLLPLWRYLSKSYTLAVGIATAKRNGFFPPSFLTCLCNVITMNNWYNSVTVDGSFFLFTRNILPNSWEYNKDYECMDNH